MLSESFIPFPKGTTISNVDELDEAIESLGFPLVIKPVNGNHGKAVTTNILTKQQAIAAFEIARELSKNVIVERFIIGIDYRLLVVNYKLKPLSQKNACINHG